MLAAAQAHPNLVTQIVPSPYGLKGHDVMIELIQRGHIGELREVQVFSLTDALGDPASPLSWRQDAALSGYNMLSLGILHETLLRWVPKPVRVLAQVHAFIPTRIDPESGVHRAVGTPDSVQVLAVLSNGARAVYHLSGVIPCGQAAGIILYGTEGVLHYDLVADRIWGLSRSGQSGSLKGKPLEEIPIAEEKARAWRVEADFVDAIRTGAPIKFTDFATGVAYMEFTEAVARSAETGEAVELPLEEFDTDEIE
jgi:predicted dehydrogenase